MITIKIIILIVDFSKSKSPLIEIEKHDKTWFLNFIILVDS